jgi:hypothetical protein
MSIVAVAVQAGSGRHVAALTIPQANRAIFFTTISFIPGILSYTIPKFAVVILIKDLLSPSRAHVIVIWALAGVSAALTVVCIAVTYSQCDPSYAFWTIGIEAKCWDPVVLVATSIVAGASSALFDFWLAIYPAAVLWGMQINLRKKVALSTALGFGIWCVSSPPRRVQGLTFLCFSAGSVAVYKCTTFKTAGEDFGDFTCTFRPFSP